MRKIPILPPEEIFATKNLAGQICLDPFMGISIDLNGDIRLCSCSHWQPTIVGNILDNTLEEILHNNRSHQIRNSIRNGTYKYCNENRCGIINNQRLTPLEFIDKNDGFGTLPSTYDRVTRSDVVDMPRYFYIAGDRICNLSCPSCRTKVITEDDEKKTIHGRVIGLLNQQVFNGSDPRPITVYVSSTGELFASPLILNFLETFPLERYPRTEFNFQTNGLLFKKRWHRLQHLENNLFNVAVTADSCRPRVYEKLRRGGNFDDLEENLRFISKLKSKLNFKFSIRMVVQQDNHDEISDFFHWAQQFDVTDVEFLRIAHWWNVFPTEDDFHKVDVLNPKHANYQVTVESLRKLKEAYGDQVVLYHFNL